jgi:ATP-dependent Lon protease
VKLNKRVPPRWLVSVQTIDDPSRLADTIAAHVALKLKDKQELLETPSPRKRLERLTS